LAQAFGKKYSIFADIRIPKPLLHRHTRIYVGGKKNAHDNGMERSVEIINGPIVLMQFK